MTKDELHKKMKQFVYQIIMTFRNYRDESNEALITEIVQSATRMSAQCRNACETNSNKKIQSGLNICKDLLEEILYLLSLLDTTRTLDVIKTESIILETVDLKQIIEKLCDNTLVLAED